MPRHVYSNNEFYDMILCVGAAHNNRINEAREVYRQRFVEGRPPAEQRHLPPYGVFKNLCLRLQRTGTFHAERSEGRPSARSVQFEQQILQHFELNQRDSTRRAGAVFNVNHMVIWHILDDDEQHPYHFSRTQELTSADYVPRINFCTWYRNRVAVNPAFSRNVLWTDEASFTRNGVLNLHNEHVWAHENPHAASQSNFQHQWRINVWAGIIGDRILGPVILPSSLNGQIYLDLLNNDIEEGLRELPVSEYVNVIYQHDGAPAHYERRVRQYLDAMYPDGWIGRGGPVAWPARSPDLTPLDFFLWGYVKTHVYAVECDTRDEMVNRINDAFSSVTTQMLRNTRSSMLRRTALCLEHVGRHFESFL